MFGLTPFPNNSKILEARARKRLGRIYTQNRDDFRTAEGGSDQAAARWDDGDAHRFSESWREIHCGTVPGRRFVVHNHVGPRRVAAAVKK